LDGCPNLSKTVSYIITWESGDVIRKENFGFGQCCSGIECWPAFFDPQISYSIIERVRYIEWSQTVHDYHCSNGSCTRVPPSRIIRSQRPCPYDTGGSHCNESDSPTVKTASGELLPGPSCCGYFEASQCSMNGGVWDSSTCTCISPIVIDVVGNSYNLTNAANGVLFDITRDGVKEQLSWTSVNSDDAWLVLDRNGNGAIDDGKKLFGSSTPQPFLLENESKNGFRALAMFDKTEKGGNNDEQIDRRDSIFSSLKLWQDTNHNGISEASELHSLSELGIAVIELDYRESRRHDENGNWFRYRAKVKDAHGAQVGRWAWDVFLQVQN